MKGTLIEILERQERDRRNGRDDRCARREYDRGTQTDWDSEVVRRPAKADPSQKKSRRGWFNR